MPFYTHSLTDFQQIRLFSTDLIMHWSEFYSTMRFKVLQQKGGGIKGHSYLIFSMIVIIIKLFASNIKHLLPIILT